MGESLMIRFFLSTTQDAVQNMSDVFGSVMTFFPIMMVVVIAISILSVVSFTFGKPVCDDIDDEEPNDEPTMEQIKKARKSAYQILAESYARGEITDEEYTDRMARL